MASSPDLVSRIRTVFRAGHYEVSQHAALRMLRRGIRTCEVEEAIAAAEIIEEYPDDKYGPSVLLLGFTQTRRPLHVQVACGRMRIVTVYEPDPAEWLDWRYRRRIDHGS
jgi:hypothetical protein